MTLSSEIITDFAVIMTIAGLVTFIFHRLRQPLILGYLIAGIIIGPYSPPFSLIGQPDVLNAASDLGVILLLFGIGLAFPLSRLRSLGFRTYLGISLIEIALMFIISFVAGQILDWSLMDRLFLATALASSSTVVIAKVLTEFGKLKETSALIMMGVLVVEDLLVVLILALITSITGNGSSGFPGLAWDVGKILLFIFGTLAIGILIIPRLIDWVAHPERDDHFEHTEHDEVLVLVALGLCFAFSVAANLTGLSAAIGAFLMGVLIASAKSAARVSSLTSHIKDMFGAMFFVSMGALIDISKFRVFLAPALVVTVIMMVGKVIGCGLGTRIFKYDRSTALKVGLGMGQIGEFALIVVKTGQDLNLISSFLFPTIGTAVAITTFLTPYMIRLSYKFNLDRWPWFWRYFSKKKS
jgi:monovalent cation:H+ antiporter-2, CPA2 family